MSDNLQQPEVDLSPWRSPRETGFIQTEQRSSSLVEMAQGFAWTLPGPALGLFLCILMPFYYGNILGFLSTAAFIWSIGTLLAALICFIDGQWFRLLGIILAWVGSLLPLTVALSFVVSSR